MRLQSLCELQVAVDCDLVADNSPIDRVQKNNLPKRLHSLGTTQHILRISYHYKSSKEIIAF